MESGFTYPVCVSLPQFILTTSKLTQNPSTHSVVHEAHLCNSGSELRIVQIRHDDTETNPPARPGAMFPRRVGGAKYLDVSKHLDISNRQTSSPSFDLVRPGRAGSRVPRGEVARKCRYFLK